MAARTNNSEAYKRTKINIIINKKIANLRVVGNGNVNRKRKKCKAADDDVNLKNDFSENEIEETVDVTDKGDCTDFSNPPNVLEVANSFEPVPLIIGGDSLLLNVDDLSDLALVDMSNLLNSNCLDFIEN